MEEERPLSYPRTSDREWRQPAGLRGTVSSGLNGEQLPVALHSPFSPITAFRFAGKLGIAWLVTRERMLLMG